MFALNIKELKKKQWKQIANIYIIQDNFIFRSNKGLTHVYFSEESYVPKRDRTLINYLQALVTDYHPEYRNIPARNSLTYVRQLFKGTGEIGIPAD